jgi:hypothetical protein
MATASDRIGSPDRLFPQLMRTNPHLVYNYRHHEEQIDSKRPENELLKPLEVAPGNKLLFQPGELIPLERSRTSS